MQVPGNHSEIVKLRPWERTRASATVAPPAFVAGEQCTLAGTLNLSSAVVRARCCCCCCWRSVSGQRRGACSLLLLLLARPL